VISKKTYETNKLEALKWRPLHPQQQPDKWREYIRLGAMECFLDAPSRHQSSPFPGLLVYRGTAASSKAAVSNKTKQISNDILQGLGTRCHRCGLRYDYANQHIKIDPNHYVYKICGM
jgi:hypothetical protein